MAGEAFKALLVVDKALGVDLVGVVDVPAALGASLALRCLDLVRVRVLHLHVRGGGGRGGAVPERDTRTVQWTSAVLATVDLC